MQSLKQLQNIFSNYVVENSFSGQPQTLYDATNYAVNSPGKRIRPLMTLAACQLFTGDAALALPQAFAIELFHNFTLVHDDIMDQATMRRGKETVHKKFGTPLAVLSGDLLMIKAYDYLIQTDQQKIKSLLHTFNAMSTLVCEGQQSDMDFEQRNDVSIDEYILMIEKKTAVLLSAAFQIGAIIGNASEQNIFHLSEFGKNLGVAFQLQDDYLDTFGNAESFGKKIGGDIFQNKKTWLLVSALSIEVAANEIKPWLLKKDFDEIEKLQVFQNIYSKHQLDQKLLELSEFYFDEAYKHLQKIETVGTDKAVLQEITDTLSGRKH